MNTLFHIQAKVLFVLFILFRKGCHVFLNLSKLSTSSWDSGKRWNSRRSLVSAARLKHPALRGRWRKKDGDKYVPTGGERSALLGGFCTILRVRCVIRGFFNVKKRIPPVTSFMLHPAWTPPHKHMHWINALMEWPLYPFTFVCRHRLLLSPPHSTRGQEEGCHPSHTHPKDLSYRSGSAGGGRWSLAGQAAAFWVSFFGFLKIWCDNVKENLHLFGGFCATLGICSPSFWSELQFQTHCPAVRTHVQRLCAWGTPLISVGEALCDKHATSHRHLTPQNHLKGNWGQRFAYILRAASAFRCVCTAQHRVCASVWVSGRTGLREDTVGGWQCWCLRSDQRAQP